MLESEVDMYKYDYIHNEDKYDSLKVFCRSENVNEDYMRSLLLKEKYKFFINKISALKTMVLILINVPGARHR